MDSSAEEVGAVEIDGNGFGGVVKMEERIHDRTEDRRDGGLKGSCLRRKITH